MVARGLYRERPAELEAGWRGRAGDAPLRRLRAALEAIVTAPPGERAAMWQGLVPPSEGWRSRLPAPDVLPDFPMFAVDPGALIGRAAAAGATDMQPLTDHETPWGTHSQGGFTDPFGHRWSVGDRTPLRNLAKPDR